MYCTHAYSSSFSGWNSSSFPSVSFSLVPSSFSRGYTTRFSIQFYVGERSESIYLLLIEGHLLPDNVQVRRERLFWYLLMAPDTKAYGGVHHLHVCRVHLDEEVHPALSYPVDRGVLFVGRFKVSPDECVNVRIIELRLLH